MSLANILKDRVTVQLRSTTATSTGETVTWTPVETRHCRVVPLSAAAIAIYQQLQSQVSHKVIFRGSISLSLGDNRLLWGSKTLEPVGPIQTLDDKTTLVMVKEV